MQNQITITPTEVLTLQFTGEDLGNIQKGIFELPYKIAQPLMDKIQRQVYELKNPKPEIPNE